MTEEQIERIVERKFDDLDTRFLGTDMTQAEYDIETNKIRQWADKEYLYSFGAII